MGIDLAPQGINFTLSFHQLRFIEALLRIEDTLGHLCVILQHFIHLIHKGSELEVVFSGDLFFPPVRTKLRHFFYQPVDGMGYCLVEQPSDKEKHADHDRAA